MKEDIFGLYNKCNLCPRRCGVSRNLGAADGGGDLGFCGESSELRLGCASIHKGEEPMVTGKGGSGTIFVSGCNLRCVFCQNYQISQNYISEQASAGRAAATSASADNVPLGRAVNTEEFTQICLALEAEGAENINIVTGSHAVPAIAAGLDAARAGGLKIPALWNTSSYETPETLEILRNRIQMFLPDLKTLDSDVSGRFYNAPDYPQAATAAIFKMIELNETASLRGIEGVIIRHLVLPGFLESSRCVLQWFADNAKGRAMLAVMTQYTPVRAHMRGSSVKIKIPSRYVSQAEYETVLGWCEEFGIEDGYCQELVTGSSWLPDFNRLNPFSSRLSKPVWHWRTGFST